MPQTATSSRLSIDTDMIVATRSVATLMNVLRDFIPQACEERARDALLEMFIKGGVELTPSALRKEYEAWKSTQIEMLQLQNTTGKSDA